MNLKDKIKIARSRRDQKIISRMMKHKTKEEIEEIKNKFIDATDKKEQQVKVN